MVYSYERGLPLAHVRARRQTRGPQGGGTSSATREANGLMMGGETIIPRGNRPGRVAVADVGGDYLEYWGKAQPLGGAESPFHPIAYHCLDVAAVMEALFAARPLVRERAAALFSASSESVARLFTALAALHDLGKFGTAFQAKRPDLIPQALRPLDAERVAPSLHTVDGFQLWEQRLGSRLAPRIWPGATASTFKPLSYGLFGQLG